MNIVLVCLLFVWYFCFFFFFQAEDGIRDVAVTGVQTCALPICRRRVVLRRQHLRRLAGVRHGDDEGVLARGRREAVAPVDEDRDVELREARGRDEIGAARRAPHPGDDDQRGAQARSGRLTAKRECLTTLGREGGQDLRHTVGIALLDGAGVVEVHSRSSVMEATSSRVSPAWSPTGQTTRSAVPW